MRPDTDIFRRVRDIRLHAVVSHTHGDSAKRASIMTSSSGRNLNKASASCSKSGRLDCCVMAASAPMGDGNTAAGDTPPHRGGSSHLMAFERGSYF